jgi:hypothetical protein
MQSSFIAESIVQVATAGAPKGMPMETIIGLSATISRICSSSMILIVRNPIE